MTQTQKTTPGPKESKAKSFLVNILTLTSDPTVFTLETKPEAGQVGRALSPLHGHHGRGPTLLACLPGHVAAWAWELESKQREGRTGGEGCRHMAAARNRQWLPKTIA
jgi:hypothetical protein